MFVEICESDSSVIDRTIEGLRSEFNSFRNLMIGGMITLGVGMVILFLTIILRSPG